MAIIYTYPKKASPASGDLVVISDVADGNKTKQSTASNLVKNNQITYTLSGDSTTGGANVVLTPSTGSSTTAKVVGTGTTSVSYNAASNQIEIFSSGASAGVSSFQTDLDGLTPQTPTVGAVTLSGTLGVSGGGTGLNTITSGQILVGNGTGAINTISLVPVDKGGTNNNLSSSSDNSLIYYNSTSSRFDALIPETNKFYRTGASTTELVLANSYFQIYVNGAAPDGANPYYINTHGNNFGTGASYYTNQLNFVPSGNLTITQTSGPTSRQLEFLVQDKDLEVDGNGADPYIRLEESPGTGFSRVQVVGGTGISVIGSEASDTITINGSGTQVIDWTDQLWFSDGASSFAWLPEQGAGSTNSARYWINESDGVNKLVFLEFFIQCVFTDAIYNAIRATVNASSTQFRLMNIPLPPESPSPIGRLRTGSCILDLNTGYNRLGNIAPQRGRVAQIGNMIVNPFPGTPGGAITQKYIGLSIVDSATGLFADATAASASTATITLSGSASWIAGEDVALPRPETSSLPEG